MKAVYRVKPIPTPALPLKGRGLTIPTLALPLKRRGRTISTLPLNGRGFLALPPSRGELEGGWVRPCPTRP
jgi:hypothetical protein